MNGFSYSEGPVTVSAWQDQSTGRVFNNDPANLENLRLALSGVRYGSAAAKLAIVGDSITLGYYGVNEATSPYLDGWAYLVPQNLQAQGTPANIGMIIPQASGVAEPR